MVNSSKAILLNNDFKVNSTGYFPHTTVGKIYDVWQNDRHVNNYVFISDSGKIRSMVKSRFILLNEHRDNIIDDILN